jgi:hypothetical protein
MEFEVKMPNKPLSSDLFRQENPGCELFMVEDKLFISGVDSVEEAQAKLDGHNPPARPEPTIADKLASVGVSIDDLKAALGL